MKNIYLIISIIILVLQNLNAIKVNQTNGGNETSVVHKLFTKGYEEYIKNILSGDDENDVEQKKDDSVKVSFDSILNKVIAKEVINLKDVVSDLSSLLKNPTDFYKTMYNYAKILEKNLGQSKSEWTKCKVFSENFKSILEKLKKIFTQLHGYNSKIESSVLTKNLVCVNEFSLNSQIYSKFYNLIKEENVIESFRTCGKYEKEFASKWSNEVKKLALFVVVSTRACEYDFYETNLNHEEFLEEIEDLLNYFTDVVLLKEFKNDQGENGLVKRVKSILEDNKIDRYFKDEDIEEEDYTTLLDKTYSFFEWKINYLLINPAQIIIEESDDLCGSYYYEDLSTLVSWCVPSVPNQNQNEKSYQREQKVLNNILMLKTSNECPVGSSKFYSIEANSKSKEESAKIHYCAYITEKFKFNDYIIKPELSETVISFDTANTTDKNTPLSVFIGCYVDSQHHDLNHSEYTHPFMTIDSCSKYCSNKGYSYFGVQNSYECFCGNKFGKYGVAKSIAECNAKCGGDSNTYCGGLLRNSIYEINIKDKNETSVFKKDYLGCSDSIKFEFLKSSKSMDLEKCSEICSLKDYSYFGVQDGSDCYCSQEYDEDSLVNSDKCDYPCTGNYKSICGGKVTKSIYKNHKSNKHSYSKHVGCFSNKPLTNDTHTSSNMSIYKCGLYCLKNYYKYFGLFNGNECSCGNHYNQNNQIESIYCAVPCHDKTDELAMCGSENAQTIYEIRDEAFDTNSRLNSNEIIFSKKKNFLVYLQSNGLIKGFDNNFDVISVNGKTGADLGSYQLKIDNSSLTIYSGNDTVETILWWSFKSTQATSPILILDEDAKLTVIDKSGHYYWSQAVCECPCRWGEANGLDVTKSYKNECFSKFTFLAGNTFKCIRNRC